MNAVPIEDPYIILKLFIQQLYTQEYAARRLWKQIHDIDNQNRQNKNNR
jgi:hypothetical protein